MSQDAFRTPDERFDSLPDYPFSPHYLELESGERLHYVDEGKGKPFLLLHGEPTWSYLYRKMIPGLVDAGYRVIAPDLLGFGRSDKPIGRMAYSFSRHVETLRYLLRHLGLRDLHLVVHDWGGPIGLRTAVLEPDRIARLVVLNTSLFTESFPLTPRMKRWIEFVADQSDLDVGRLIQSGCVGTIPEEVVRAYEAPFPSRESRGGVRVFPLLIPQSMTDPGAREMRETQDALMRHTWPTLVLWSDQDHLFPPAWGRYLTQIFAGARMELIEGAGHFLQEERAPVLVSRILEFCRGDWR